MGKGGSGDSGPGMAYGTLYVVATPIGNLEDLTLRAARVLGEVELVAAEDTRRTATLLRHVGSGARMVSIHRFSEEARKGKVLDHLREGRDVALVSDAGTPLLSDPGARLVALAREEGIPVVPVPGPSAVTAALSVAGLTADRFLFMGFLPSKAEQRRKALEAIKGLPYTLVFYEAPHRIHSVLQDMVAILGDRRCLVAREMSKVHETYLFGPISQVLSRLGSAKGEITVVVEGSVQADGGDEGGLRALIRILVQKAGLSPRICGKLLAHLGLGTRKDIYNIALEMKEERSNDRSGSGGR